MGEEGIVLRRFKEKYPGARRLAGRFLLSAALLYGCGLLILASFRVGLLGGVTFVYALWLLVEILPELLRFGRLRRGKRSWFGRVDESRRQCLWTVAFAAAGLYCGVGILIVSYTSQAKLVFFTALFMDGLILLLCLPRAVRAIRGYAANRSASKEAGATAAPDGGAVPGGELAGAAGGREADIEGERRQAGS